MEMEWKSCALCGLPKKSGTYIVTAKLAKPEEGQEKMRWVFATDFWKGEKLTGSVWPLIADCLQVVAYMEMPKKYKGR